MLDVLTYTKNIFRKYACMYACSIWC